MVNFIYQTPKVTEGALKWLVNDWQISGVYRLSSGQPYAIIYSIPGVGNANLSGTSNPAARIALTCDPGSGTSSDPYKQFANTSCFAPPQQGSDGLESSRRFVHGPGTNNLDLSISKTIPIGKVRMEVRLDAFNALNHTQFTGVNNTANFASADRPHDHQLALQLGRTAGQHQRVRDDQRGCNPADRAAGHPADVLGRSLIVVRPGVGARPERAPAPFLFGATAAPINCRITGT